MKNSPIERAKRKKIHKLRKNMEDVENRVNVLQKLLEEEQSSLKDHQKTIVKLSNPEIGVRFDISGWKCDKSPLRVCVYGADDPGHDMCHFCHNPEERK